jgi:hypothetical protein
VGPARASLHGAAVRAGELGVWEEEVGDLMLSASQTTAMVPYLLQAAGFNIEAVQRMAAVNRLPTTRAPGYVVVTRGSG